MNVRFEGNNGRDAAVKRCLLMTIADIPAFASFRVTTILPFEGGGREACHEECIVRVAGWCCLAQRSKEEPVNPLDRRNQRARPAPLRIMTYNVHRCVGADGRADPRRIAEVIAACQPDMVALQELDVGRLRTGGIDQAHAIAQLLGMSFHFHPALQVEEELYGDAILTALPMRLVKAGPLPGSVGFEPRGALWAAVEANGTEIQIINTHLGLPAYERMAQARTLLGQNWLGHPDGRDPVIVLGDFNARRRSVVYRRFTARLRDAQLVLHKRARRTFPARMPLLCIDHIFCSRSVDVLGVEVPRSQLVRTASDHLPLVMDFRIVEHERTQVSAATDDGLGASG